MGLVLLTALCVFFLALAPVSTPLIEAEEGHDVVLQCPAYPGPDVDLSKSSVTWREDEENNIVHVYTRGHDRAYDQKEEFRNRTSLDHEGLRKGNVSVRLLLKVDGENGTGYDVKYMVIPIVCALGAVILLILGRLMIWKKMENEAARNGAGNVQEVM